MSATDAHQQHRGQLWFEDGNMVLLAEQTMFKVHRSILARQSEFFKDMLSLPDGGHAQSRSEEGTEACPLRVPDASAAGLGALLAIIYDVNSWWTELGLGVAAYADALRIAHRLQFPAVFTGRAAISLLENLSLAAPQKLQLGLACDIDAWQQQAFQDIVLGFQEYPRANDFVLDDKTWLQVYEAREQICQNRLDEVVRVSSSPLLSLGLPCQHKISAYLCAVPSTPHSQLLDKSNDYLSKFLTHECCAAFTQGAIDFLSVDERTERRTVAAFWKGQRD